MRNLVLLCFSVSFIPMQAQTIDRQAVQPTVSAHEIQDIRAAVLPDLRAAMEKAYNDLPTDSDLKAEYRQCKFEHLALGKLGTAIAVTWPATGAPNANLIALYRKNGRSYTRLYEGIGFGPEVIAGRKVPDLVVGGTLGQCHEVFTRLRFNGSVYKPDACIRHDRNQAGSCVALKCDNALPIFPDPYPEE